MVRIAYFLMFLMVAGWLAPTAHAQDLKKLAARVAEQGQLVNELRSALKKNDGSSQRAQHDAAVAEYNARVRIFNHAIARANQDVADLNRTIAAYNKIVAEYNRAIAESTKKKIR
ncbi:MAG: hypothetical protein HYX68_20085 [Planctomycetes bacterium]|nr:hypothetical protein [Planctomycetota bacterium]